jgi:hypothetical protein
MATDSDLQTQINTLNKKLTATEGKANAAARAQAAAERERDQAATKAQAYRDETDLMIANAAQQLSQAWAIGVGIWSLAQWSGRIAHRKVYAARLLHREHAYVKVLSDLTAAVKSGDKSALDISKRDAEKLISLYATNTEQVHLATIEALLINSGKLTKERLDHVWEILSAPEENRP